MVFQPAEDTKLSLITFITPCRRRPATATWCVVAGTFMLMLPSDLIHCNLHFKTAQLHCHLVAAYCHDLQHTIPISETLGPFSMQPRVLD